MKAELKIAREEIAELRREGENERHWLYTKSSLEECLASLEIISRLIQKKTIFLNSNVPQPGKKTTREESHGAHKETDTEKAGGSIAESESIAENSE